ncbi:alpha/beta fold hydrolase [Dechloromonas sp. A34]|uniref:alpha/beta fold hydrolase n=1 Tax=Dechloromonas sp. A34 TaxID=447588 RepID=UPI002248EAAA|nr:alpha/beta hydrolase [Dechloromonas sp. A34]
MASVRANGIRLEYESFGPERAPAILLIMGLGGQMTRWNLELCELLVARGYRVIRFDNRDSGLSSHFDDTPVPNLRALQRGEPVAVPYTLDDMAADSIGLLDALDIERAHVVGASMGGAIAQIAAARYPARVRSLTSIMSSSGNPALPSSTPAAATALFAPLPRQRDRESIVADSMARYATLESPAYPTERERLRRMFATEYDRNFDPRGVGRQLAAIIASGDRRPLLQTITAPTVVVHGAADQLIPAACGEDVARHIAGAELRLIAGMGHDFPVALSAVIADAICAAAGRA